MNQCKLWIPPSLPLVNRASQVLIVMHHHLHPLPQEKSVIHKSKDLLPHQMVSNTDFESIKQAGNQTKSKSKPPKRCSVPCAKEDPRKNFHLQTAKTRSISQVTPDLPNTRPLQLAARDDETLRQASDLSDQNHEQAFGS
jgi:hypothetical protein